MPLDQPAFGVGPPEVDQGEVEGLGGSGGLAPEQVLLEHPDEPLGATIAFGRAERGSRGRPTRVAA